MIDWARRRGRSLARLTASVVFGTFVDAHPAPIIVVGNQKSGTTVVAAALARVGGLAVTQDLMREVVRPMYAEIADGRSTIQDLVTRNAWDFRRPIIKEPHLTPFVDQLGEQFPDSPFATVVRQPADNIRSILDRIGVSAAEVEHALDRPIRNRRGWELVLDPGWLGREVDTVLEGVCERWNLCAEVSLRDDMVSIRYEDYQRDPNRVAAELAGAVGLDVVGELGEAASTDHQPRGANRGTAPAEFFSSEQLAVIEQRCGSNARLVGYADAIGS